MCLFASGAQRWPRPRRPQGERGDCLKFIVLAGVFTMILHCVIPGRTQHVPLSVRTQG